MVRLLQVSTEPRARRFEVSELDHGGGMGRVCGVAEEVEGGGVGWVSAGEGDVFDAAACVEAIHLGEVEGRAVDDHGARAADVEHAEFTALEEVVRAQLGLVFRA